MVGTEVHKERVRKLKGGKSVELKMAGSVTMRVAFSRVNGRQPLIHSRENCQRLRLPQNAAVFIIQTGAGERKVDLWR